MAEIFQTNEVFNSEAELCGRTGINSWTKLVMDAYGFAGNENYQQLQFRTEYSKKEGSVITAIRKDGKVIASLVLTISDLFTDLAVFSVHGIAVLPEFKGQGLGKKLYEIAVRESKADVITGSTKTPAAVLARANGLVDIPMRTFFGLYEVTSPERCGYTFDHEGLLEEYLKAKGVILDIHNPVLLKSIDILRPNIPDVLGFPSYIQQAFQLIIDKQIEIGDSQTVTLPLISIRE